MTETAMSAAFAKRGKKGPQARLHDMAISARAEALFGIAPDEPTDDSDAEPRLKETALMALEQNPANMAAALGLFLQSLSQDAGALNALIGGDRVRARASEYLHGVWNDTFGEKGVKVKAHDRSKPGGHPQAATQMEGAARSGGDQRLGETQGSTVPAALSPERLAGARMRWHGWFDREVIRGRPLGDLTYTELHRSALLSRDSGLNDLRQAYIQVRLLKSVAWHPGMDDKPVRSWASEDAIDDADARFNEFGQLLVGEIDQFLLENGSARP